MFNMWRFLDYNGRFFNTIAIILAAWAIYTTFTNSSPPATIDDDMYVTTPKGKYEIVLDPDKSDSEYSFTERLVLYLAKDKVEKYKEKHSAQMKQNAARDEAQYPKVVEGARVKIFIASLDDQNRIQREEVTLVIGAPGLKAQYIEISQALIGKRARESIVVNTTKYGRYSIDIIEVILPGSLEKTDTKDDSKPD